MIKALDKPLEDIEWPYVVGKKGRYKKKCVCDTINVLDTETTNFYIGMSGVPQPYDYNNPLMEEPTGDYNRKGEPIKQPMKKGALLWIWQAKLNGNKFYGRSLADLRQFLLDWHKVCPDLKILYIHNADFDTTFMWNIFTPNTVFAARSHAPLYIYIPEINVEIRDTAELTHMSLATWGNELGLPKLKGDLDYDLIRTPLTPIDESSKEFGYCMRDIDVMDLGLQKYKRKYGTVHNIPLTQTGELRRELQDLFACCPSYTAKCHKAWDAYKILYNKDGSKIEYNGYEVYNFLDLAFWGGVVICNPTHRGVTIREHVNMKDLASSYPWVLISEKFPIGKLQLVERPEDYESYLSDQMYGCFVEIEVTNCQTKTDCLEMSISHIQDEKDVVSINGRMASAVYFKSVMYETDLELFKKFYDYDSLKITKMYISRLEYLPEKFRKYIIDLYKNKTNYKDVEGKEAIYSISKQYINACYGVFVQRLLRPELNFNFSEISWDSPDMELYSYRDKLMDLLYTKNNREKTIYITPQIGIAVTAYARRNLFAGFGDKLEMETYIIYTDTDSIKYKNNPYAEEIFNKYNSSVLEKHKEIAKQLGLKPEDLSPKTPKGEPKPIGIFAFDGETELFRSCGSKKYVYLGKNKKTGEPELKMTLAGVPKDNVKLLEGNIENFTEKFKFTPAAAHEAGISMKLTPYYLYDMEPVTFPDGWEHTDKFGVCLMPTGYELGYGDDLYPSMDEFNAIVKHYDENSAIRNNLKRRIKGVKIK